MSKWGFPGRYAHGGRQAVDMSESVMPMIKAYDAGSITWPALRIYLVGHDWSASKPIEADARTFNSEWYWDVEADIGVPAAAGTWAEFQQARNYGLVTEAELMEVLKVVYEQAQARVKSHSTDQVTT